VHKFGIADIEQLALRVGGDASHRLDDLWSRRRSTHTPTFNGDSTKSIFWPFVERRGHIWVKYKYRKNNRPLILLSKRIYAV
jgi:hypothetical protein